jgi:hypothetical protein
MPRFLERPNGVRGKVNWLMVLSFSATWPASYEAPEGRQSYIYIFSLVQKNQYHHRYHIAIMKKLRLIGKEIDDQVFFSNCHQNRRWRRHIINSQPCRTISMVQYMQWEDTILNVLLTGSSVSVAVSTLQAYTGLHCLHDRGKTPTRQDGMITIRQHWTSGHSRHAW